MADEKITQLTEETAPANEDLIVVVNDPSGSPANEKVTIASLQRLLAQGWIPSQDTWTYASATSFTISGVDRTGVYKKGTYVRFKQGAGYKYGVVSSSSFSTNTTVNLISNTDYSVANSTITDNDYSYAAAPLDWPGFFNYTPTIDGNSGSAGTYAQTIYHAKYSVVGHHVYIKVLAEVTNKGSWSGNVRVSNPITPVLTNDGPFGYITNNGGTWNAGSTFYGPPRAATQFLFRKGIGASDVQWSDMTATFTIQINGMYQI